MKHTVYIACLAVLLSGAAIAQEVTSSVSSGIGVVMPPKASAMDAPVSSNGTVSTDGTFTPPSDPSVGVSEPYTGMGEPGAVGGSPGMGGYPQDEPPVDGFAPQIPPCGHQDLVGKNIKDVDVKALGTVRVLYPDSMVTEDFSPTRINIILEKGTDIITQVTCG